jgi:hypothetical protein
MKLGDLTYIKRGVKIPNNLLVTLRPSTGTYFSYLLADDLLQGGTGKFVSEKDARKHSLTNKAFYLEYGDYIFVIKNGEVKITRFEQVSGRTIFSDDVYVITSSVAIVETFLGYEKNRAYVTRSIKDALSSNNDIHKVIADIEINTDNIKEIDENNLAEQYGIRKPLDKSALPIRLLQKPLPLDKLMKRIDNKELLLDTEFQRRPDLWDIGTKSRLLEAMIIKLPIPAFYFDGADDDQWLVIDGLQRLSAVHAFINDEYELQDLDYLTELSGKKFSELERSYKRNIEEFEVFVYVLEKGTPKNVIYKIFKNINTSALRLEGQEIRHAINPGKPSELLKEIAVSDWFKKGVPIAARQCDRMYDREVVLRFLAFKTRGYREYSPSMPDFLDDSIVHLYDEPQHKIEEYKKEFQKIIGDIHDTFGGAAFSRSVFEGTQTYKHNNILFELLTYAYSKNRKLGEQKENTKIQLETFFQNRPSFYWDNEQAYSQSGLLARFEEIEKFIATIK